jgi:hypothetical protein
MQLNRKTTPIKMRNYGRIIQDMIEYACRMEDMQQREALVSYVAQCMRQKNAVWNRDQDSGIARVAEDIERLSGGVLHYEMPQAQERVPAAEAPAPAQQPRLKKKKK